MVKDYLLLGGALAIGSGAPHLMVMVDEKLGISFASVSRVAKALHCSALTTLGMVMGLLLGYMLGVHS